MAPAWWKKGTKCELGGGRRKGKDWEAVAKGKAKSFDEALGQRRRNVTTSGEVESPGGSAGGRSSVFTFDFEVAGGTGGKVGHPLPRPVAAPTLTVPEQSGFCSISSVSSSGSSSEENPDLSLFRCSEASTVRRGRSVVPGFKLKHHRGGTGDEQQERPTSVPVSPTKDSIRNNSNFFLNGGAYPHQTLINETARSRQGSASPGPKPRGYVLPFAKQDDTRGSPHPLPLPPGSPTSPPSRQLQSKWKKGKLIGSGTFGRVYAGFDSEKGQMCAIKEVEVISDDSNSKESLKQLSQEINLLSQLSHPNIVQYLGSEMIDDVLSVYLEHVSGGSIHKLLQDYGPFTEAVIRSYTRQILSGLSYLHGRNTIHRDIKGANILVGTNGDVKLADFGMAKHISSSTSIRSFKGSPYWMAPEVIMNTNGYGLAADIWSLGCTVLEMATAKSPWNSYTAVQAIFKIGNTKDSPEIPSNLSNEAKSFVKLCLHRDPSARPTATQLLEHPFVRSQTKSRELKSKASREIHPSTDGTLSPTYTDLTHGRSISPLQTRRIFGNSAALNRSEPVSMRMNFSLPESPCSSPLRQIKPSNWSCFPSPSQTNPILGIPNQGLGRGLTFPLGSSSRYTDNWQDILPLKSRSPYGSPRG